MPALIPNWEEIPEELRKLQSHGPQSSLVEHTWQVSQCAKEPWEKVAAICHDVLKAHPEWQSYAKHFRQGESPFHHAAGGGLLAYLILREHGEKELAWAALHTASAHHSNLGNLVPSEVDREIGKLASSKECSHFAEKLLALWASIPEETTQKAFQQLGKIQDPLNPQRKELERLASETRVEVAQKARGFLGWLCLFDHRSAAHQQGKKSFSTEAPSQNTFRARQTKKAFHTGLGINPIREEFLERTLNLPTDSSYYILYGSTGVGKSNAGISLAEKICTTQKKERIVYAAALTSIGDQTFSEYFGEEGDNAQIWNYKRRETATKYREDDPETTEIAVLESPFARSFNVTTFNQILLALLHPSRNYAINGLSLRNCVIIFDEYHAIPTESLQALLEVLDKKPDIQSIFMSATPENEQLWDHRPTSRLEPEFIKKMKNAPHIKNRRRYQKEGDKSPEEMAEIIQDHRPNDGDMLVMVNLIGRGTVPIAKACGIPSNPWERWTKNKNGAALMWLDGTTPPCLRQAAIATLQKNRGTGQILLCTPIIKAGVDLDFDSGWEDFLSLKDSVQTGGRVGRHKGGGKILRCFSLITDIGASRHVLQKLNETTLCNKFNFPHWDKEKPLRLTLETRLQEKHRLEEKTFQDWSGIVEEETLLAWAEELSKKITPLPSPLLPLACRPQPGRMGLSLESWDALANLYGGESGDQILLIPPNTSPKMVEAQAREDKAYSIKIEQQFTIRCPIPFQEMLMEEGGGPTSHKVNDSTIWTIQKTII